MKVGNIVKPTKESGFYLVSGGQWYDEAVIISLEARTLFITLVFQLLRLLDQ